MALFPLRFRDKLQSKDPTTSKSGLLDELDGLTTRISSWASVAHNEDGTPNFRPLGYDVVPVGAMIKWPITIPPAGWLTCDGSAVSRAAYPILFKTIGIVAGAGDGVNTFNIPNSATFIILAA